MKLSRVEQMFDGGRLIFYFTAEGRIDFRELVRLLAAEFRTRIEMRQIGVRDEARMIGGYGSCGRPLCCTSWLQTFEPVSIRMAKQQDLALNPSKLSGLCRHQYEHGRGGRFLERLQQRVLRRIDERIGVIDDDHPPAAFKWTVPDPIEQLADDFDLDVAGLGVWCERDDVRMHPACDAAAGGTQAAGIQREGRSLRARNTFKHHVGAGLQTVEGLRERHRGPPLPHPAAAREQEARRERPPGNGAREETERQPVTGDVSERHGSRKFRES